jgi:hypothetical protein
MKSLLLIPDIQAKPGDPLTHIECLNRYILDKRPDVVVQIGDLWDFPALSSYDKGKRAAEGRRLTDDWEIGCLAVAVLMDGWDEAGYWPELCYTKGNHEYRVNRYESDFPELEGSLPNCLSFMEDMGWNAYEFLTPVRVEGIMFCHMFPKNSYGRITAQGVRMGASSTRTQMNNNKVGSIIAGHRQGLESTIHPTADGRVRSIIAGSYYMHDETYMGPQGNDHWRGVLMLNRCNGKGDFDLTEVSLDYLLERYGE